MAKLKKKYHFIYKTTCIVTGKFYVGMHSTDYLDDGYLGSGKILGYSRSKYGDENHKIEILEFLSSRDKLKQREKELVNEELLADPLNMNLKYGGEGGWTLDASRRGGAKSGGPRNASKHVLYMADAEYASKFRNKIRDGLAASDKWKLIKADAQKRITIAAMSDEAKQKRKATFEERQHQAGERNSQFGTCWVSNGKPMKIKIHQLDEYLANGYRRGRK